MATTATAPRTPRQATPERWQAALARAFAEGVQVRQLAGSGAWLATSGTDATKAYELEIVNGIVRSCSCPAGTFGDPCCKHAARFYLDAGLLDVDDPEPDPPAPGGTAQCWNCSGGGVVYVPDCARAGWPHPPCPVCGGSGELAVPILTTHVDLTMPAA